MILLATLLVGALMFWLGTLVGRALRDHGPEVSEQQRDDIEAAALRQAAAQDAERQRRKRMFAMGHKYPKGSA